MAEEDVNEAENTENAEGEGEDGEAAAEGGNKKKMIILIAIPVLLLLIGGGLYFSGIFDSADETHAEAVEGEHGEGHAEEGHDEHGEGEEEGHAAFYAMPDFIVNLSSDSGARFLKLRVQLELKDEADIAGIEAITPRVIDQFQTYLREMRVEDLKGSAGIYRLRQELLYRVNIAAHPIKVNDVLFQEMLIQ